MSAPQTVIDLVQRFESQLPSYKSGRYNETELRRDFLDPFFEALGWDIRNLNNAAERYRDVIHEQSVEIGTQAKTADYLFKIGETPVFFAEAKKPSVNIETDPAPAFQLKSYAWSKKLPFSILTDFEQLAFYDCSAKPVYNALPSLGRVALYSFRDYVPRWDEIASRISRTAVTSGAFDTFVKGISGKRGTTDVDDAFLAEMERWRDALAHNLALRNTLTQRELNFAVQVTIDRLIFLRICEDRGIEPEETLKNATDGVDVYGDLLELFRRADRKYNSGLFHFSAEKGRPGYPDSLTPSLKIDDKVFKDILANLYLPKSPYRFNYFSADILGQVYERFLGKVITLSPGGHRAEVTEKPEVRKAGGVYYTPTYIVDYIVKNTVGGLLKDRAPDSFASSPLRVLDPACGSGSFLLGAYQYLMDWYLDWYVNHEPARHARGASPAVIEVPGGWQLTLEKKKDILTRHIYGVDIDSQAGEVTKLSLLLKVVENPGQLSLYDERILPDLSANIKCGNSLIGPDFYEGRQGSLFNDEEHYRVNAFDWQAEFSQVFADGGFDAVIGNPPYIRIQAMKEWAPLEVEFYKKAYKSASKGNYDIYVVFVEKGLGLLNPNGKLGFILPHKFFNSQYGEPLRGLIAKNRNLNKVIHFGDEQIFENATTYTCLLFLTRSPNDEFAYIKNNEIVSSKLSLESLEKIHHEKVTNSEWNFINGRESILFDKLNHFKIHLGDIANLFVGIQTSADTVFLFKGVKESDRHLQELFSKELGSMVKLEKEILKPVVRSGEIGRYWANPTAKILFPYKITSNKALLLNAKEMACDFPEAWEYLTHNRKFLEQREKNSFKDEEWYRFGRNQNIGMWEQQKILIPYMTTRLSAYLDISEHLYFINVTTGGYGVTLKDEKINYWYLTGLLNSKLLNFYFVNVTTPFHGGYYAANKQFIAQLPICTIDFSQPNELALHDQLVALVESMLALHKSLAAAQTPAEKERLQRQVAATDKQIDNLVYRLYDLTPAEIAIIEGSS